MFYWAEWKPMPLPDGSGELVLLTKGLHPFLAESSRRVHIKTATVNQIVDLPTNVGGEDIIDAYWYPASDERGPFVRLVDHWGEYLLDLREGKSYVLVRRRGAVFAVETTSSGGTLWWNEIEGEVEVNGQPAPRADDWFDKSGGQHLGRFR